MTGTLLQQAVRRAEELAADNAFLKSVGVSSIDGDNEILKTEEE
jgi:hypothetical protein